MYGLSLYLSYKKIMTETNFQTFNINTTTPYNYILGNSLLWDIGNLCRKIKNPCKVCIISDEKVFSLYGNVVQTSLDVAYFHTYSFKIPEGETNKSLNTVESIISFLNENNFNRDDILIALGGGMIGDITGFAASIYMRGINFIQIPTTFLSAIDASIGGKTGVNLKYAKNLIGSFHQPSLVICSIETFRTLPQEDLRNGLVEALKMAIIKDSSLFYYLKKLSAKQHLRQDFTQEHPIENTSNTISQQLYNLKISSDDFMFIIEKSIAIKTKIVIEDEKEQHTRVLLNFGHTLGHAIESYSKFTISHGTAVALGMIMESFAMKQLEFVKTDFSIDLYKILYNFGITPPISLDAKLLENFIQKDKKNRENHINIPTVTQIGESNIYKVSKNTLTEFVSESLNILEEIKHEV